MANCPICSVELTQTNSPGTGGRISTGELLCQVCLNKLVKRGENLNYFGIEDAIKFRTNQHLRPPPIVLSPKAREQIGGFVVIGIVALVFWYNCSSNSSDNEKSEAKARTEEAARLKTLTPQQRRKERLQKLFSSWDGSLRPLNELIKASMHNPDSFEHVETVYWDQTDHLMVRTKFRGTNVFGGIVTNTWMVKTDTLGRILQIVQREP